MLSISFLLEQNLNDGIINELLVILRTFQYDEWTFIEKICSNTFQYLNSQFGRKLRLTFQFLILMKQNLTKAMELSMNDQQYFARLSMMNGYS